MKFLRANAPRLSTSLIEQLARQHFALEGTIKPLYSERDQNLCLRDAHGAAWVLKIANVAEDPAIIDCQIETLRHIARVDPALPVPRVRLTRDGVPIESFQGTSRWTPPIAFGSVDRVEVIRGPASVLYGSSAMGGAINFLPKPLPRAESGGQRLDALVESQYFSNNRERYANGEISGALAAGLGFRAGASRRVADNFRTADALPYTVTRQKGDPLYTGELRYSNYDQRSQYGQLGGSGAWGQLQLLYDGFEGFNNFPNANGKPAGVAMATASIRGRYSRSATRATRSALSNR